MVYKDFSQVLWKFEIEYFHQQFIVPTRIIQTVELNKYISSNVFTAKNGGFQN